MPDLTRGHALHRERIREIQERSHVARVDTLRANSELRQRHNSQTSEDAGNVHWALRRQAIRRGVTETERLRELLRDGGPSGSSAAWGEVARDSEHTQARLNATRAFLRRGRFSAGRAGEPPQIGSFSDFMVRFLLIVASSQF